MTNETGTLADRDLRVGREAGPEIPIRGFTEIRVRGKTVRAPSARINGKNVVVTGRVLKIAAVEDEDLEDNKTFERPESFLAGLKQCGLSADLFTFSQKLPDTEPKHSFHLEWDNYATVPITTYKEWLEKRVEYDVRKAIKKSVRAGVVVKVSEFNDVLVQGIVDIYSESATRQGKAFWHYQKDFATVKLESGTHLDKCEFICAYLQDELIGFIKLAYIGKIAATIHVIAKKKHFDKKATNALLAKAVEICEQKGATHLTYGNYIYDDPASSLTEFKRRSGFEKFLLPRYYVPLTAKGRIALALRAHHGVRAMIPPAVKRSLLKARAAVHERLAKPRPVPVTPSTVARETAELAKPDPRV
jgi:hypothetical protein